MIGLRALRPCAQIAYGRGNTAMRSDPMDELIARITAATGIDQDMAQKAVGLMLGFLKQEGPDGADGGAADDLVNAISGAGDAVEEPSGGGVMGLGGQLMGMGLGMGEITSVAKETIGYAKEKIGEDKVDEVVNAIPGLSQFV